MWEIRGKKDITDKNTINNDSKINRKNTVKKI